MGTRLAASVSATALALVFCGGLSPVLPGCAAPAPARPAQRLVEENPPAPGFDRAGSDPRAVAIADRTMRAMGGRRAWDQTRYISWRFFGKRLHVWDKWTG